MATAPSDDFLDSIVTSHRVAVLVDVLRDGEPLDPAVTLDTVLSGGVTLDSRAAIRGRCDITLADDGNLGWVPTVPTDPLAPYGNELSVSRGIRFDNGTVEYAHLGVFRIDSADVNDQAGQLQIQLTGLDRSARIIDARFEEATQIASGTNLATAIVTNLITPVYPGVTTRFTTTTHTTPQIIAEEGGDRWAVCQDLATAAGMRLFFDGEGILVLEPDTVDDPVAELAEGENGVLLSAGRRWSRQGAFNRVIATGENTGEVAPVRGVATDTNPLSPTYFYGPFGQVPRFFQSQFIVTADQAQDAATAMLARELGTSQSLSLGSLVLPYLQPSEVVRVTRARVGLNAEDHIIDSVTIPLGADQAMMIETRATQVF